MTTPDDDRMAFTWWEVEGDGVKLLHNAIRAPTTHESWKHDLPGIIKRNRHCIWVGALYCPKRDCWFFYDENDADEFVQDAIALGIIP